ncbi:MAG TPA: hypothetical protein VLB44_15920 [Kofleriaceae bacterium]|nr:hypothetical protein [Kofleriaceae bacterium]
MRAQRIGELCVDADQAIADGDLSGLRRVAERLAAYSHEPLHCELEKLVDACRENPQHAVALWGQLRERLFRASA